MLKRLGCAFAIALGVCTASAAQAPDLDAMDIVLKSVPDGPAAKVNGRLIDGNVFKQMYRAELVSLMRQNPGLELTDPMRAELGLRCLSLLVERELLYDEAVKRKVDVPADHIEKAWQAQLAQTQKVIKEREGKDLTEDEVLARLGFNKRDEVFASLERALVTEKLRATIIREADVKVTDEEIQQQFTTDKADYGVPARMHLQQIFINASKMNGTKSERDTQARAKAQQALDRVMSGQSFEGVARAMSDAPDASKGGDMGMMAVAALPPFMSETASRLKPGEISNVFESQYGLHVIKLVGVEAAKEANLEEASRMVRARLLAERGADVVRKYCNTLLDAGATVSVYLELEKNLLLNGVRPAG